MCSKAHLVRRKYRPVLALMLQGVALDDSWDVFPLFESAQRKVPGYGCPSVLKILSYPLRKKGEKAQKKSSLPPAEEIGSNVVG